MSAEPTGLAGAGTRRPGLDVDSRRRAYRQHTSPLPLPAFTAPQSRVQGPGLRATRSVPRRQRGYTLIEVIVAFALLALALTLLLGTLSGAVRQVRWSSDAGRAALHAQSLMDTVGVGQVLLPGRRDGQFDGGRYRWELTVAPWDEPLPPGAPVVPRTPAFHRLYEVALSVQWGDGGPRERVDLRTLRLAPVQPGAVLP